MKICQLMTNYNDIPEPLRLRRHFLNVNLECDNAKRTKSSFEQNLSQHVNMTVKLHIGYDIIV